jgi:hypothetical protein
VLRCIQDDDSWEEQGSYLIICSKSLRADFRRRLDSVDILANFWLLSVGPATVQRVS